MNSSILQKVNFLLLLLFRLYSYSKTRKHLICGVCVSSSVVDRLLLLIPALELSQCKILQSGVKIRNFPFPRETHPICFLIRCILLLIWTGEDVSWILMALSALIINADILAVNKVWKINVPLFFLLLILLLPIWPG